MAADGTPNHTVTSPSLPAPAPCPPASSCSPHLQPGLHLVQHSCVQDVNLGLQDLHGLLGMEIVRGERVGGGGGGESSAAPQPWGEAVLPSTTQVSSIQQCPPGQGIPLDSRTHHEAGALQPN